MVSTTGFITLFRSIPLLGVSCIKDAFIGVRDDIRTGCAMPSPRLNFWGEVLRLSLKGDGGGRRAGLVKTLDDIAFAGDDGAASCSKLNLETLAISLIGLIGRFAGDLLRALTGVFSPASSSSLMGSDLAT